MKYEIGQKVETQFGKGEVFDTNNSGDMYHVELKDGSTKWFWEKYLKPYKTPHEKLLDMGFKVVDTIIEDNIRLSNGITSIYVDTKRNEIFCDKTNLELSRILTEYLEWLEEEK